MIKQPTLNIYKLISIFLFIINIILLIYIYNISIPSDISQLKPLYDMKLENSNKKLELLEDENKQLKLKINDNIKIDVTPCPTNKIAVQDITIQKPIINIINEKPIISIDKPYLLIALPTIPRKNNENYLSQTVDYLIEQLPKEGDKFYQQVHILISFMKKDISIEHNVFNNVKERYKNSKHSFVLHFETIDAPNDKSDIPEQIGNLHLNVPNYHVRAQSRDLVRLMATTDKFPSQYVLFMEDDFQLCKNGMTAILNTLEKAKTSTVLNNWLVIRISYGFNGILMPSADVSIFKNYLSSHFKRRPPDHLIVEWYAGEKPESKAYKGNRPHAAFKWNLLNHIGEVSTLRSISMVGFSKCYEVMAEPILFEVDAFKPQLCPRDDIWPCPNDVSKQTIVDYPNLI